MTDRFIHVHKPGTNGFTEKYFISHPGEGYLYHQPFTLDQPSPYYSSEEQLVTALKKHKNDAYRYLYTHYRGSLYNVILQIIPETETANDVLQETFVTLWQTIERYDPAKGRLYTWLYNLTRNAAINKTRSKNYKNSLKNESLTNYVNNHSERTAFTPVLNHIGIRDQVMKLRSDYRAVVELSYFNGYTQEEISQILQVPLGTVKTRLRSAVLELRKNFEQ